ncbi:MAG TPA: hypothetical protein PK728_12045 [Bacillota bacterium]|nr:hypothetical protein [Bacillota bacterium]
MICPRKECGGEELFRVYFGQGKDAWRCMKCDTVYTFREIRHEDGEMSRISIWARKRVAPAG